MSRKEEGPLTLTWAGIHIAVHALLFFACFHPLALWPLAFVCAAPLARVVRDLPARWAYPAGFVGYFLHGALAVEWLSLLGLPPWLGTAFGFGLYGLLFAWGARAAKRLGGPAWVWLPIIWAGIEHLRGTLFFYAFPWVYLGHAVYPLPMIQAADLGGQILVSFAVAIGSGVALDLWDQAAGRAGPKAKSVRARRARRLLLSYGALLAALNVYGLVRPGTIEVEEGPTVLAVQTNIPQRVKNDESNAMDLRVPQLIELTERGARAGAPPDIVAWPETIVPVLASRRPGYRYDAVDHSPELQRFFRDLGKETGAKAFLVGSRHQDLDRGEMLEHNSIFCVDGRTGRSLGRYDKVQLAPMSEYTPFRAMWPALYRWLRESFIPPGFNQFERGQSTKLFFEESAFPVGGSVCFDVTFAAATRATIRAGARGVVNVSNYAWFQDSAELDLARVHTMFRAIETRRGFVCAVNAGITHFVDPRGEVTDLVVGGETKEVPGTLLRPLTTSNATTLFLLTGELFAWLLVAGGALIILAGLARGLGLRREPEARPVT